VGEPGDAELGRDPEDATVFGAAGVAAGRPDELGLTCDLRDCAQLRRRPVAMEPDDPLRRWHRRARYPVKGKRLCTPDPRRILPSTLPPGSPEGLLDGSQVERPAALDNLVGYLGSAQASRPVRGCPGGGRELEPASAVAVQPSGTGNPPAFRLEHRDGRFRQVDGPPIGALDDDSLVAACAAL
jgi:hypothetical protein